MDIAVPANLRCGQPEGGTISGSDDGAWAPLTLTFSGIWEIQPGVLAERLADCTQQQLPLQLLDVREPHEFNDALGHIPGALLLPLQELAQRMSELDRERPLVAICRSGARSAQATVLLRKAGLVHVANLAGGMLRWRAEQLPVEGGLS
jgi:rhodanese-related sulfurtransferase